MAVIGKKQLEKWVKGSWEWNIQLESTIIQKKKQSCLILLVHPFHFNLAEFKQNLHIIMGKPNTWGKNICVTSSYLIILGHPFKFQISDSWANT